MRQRSPGHCLNCALSRALGQLNAFGANRALAADGDDSISIVIGEGCTASQRGHYVTVDTGDGVAVLTQEPVDVTFAEGSVFSVVVARAALLGRIAMSTTRPCS